jgi:hypothetical protein
MSVGRECAGALQARHECVVDVSWHCGRVAACCGCVVGVLCRVVDALWARCGCVVSVLWLLWGCCHCGVVVIVGSLILCGCCHCGR